MVFWAKSKEASSQLMTYIRNYSLPVYIVVSAVFIIYVLWTYAMSVVFNAGVLQGQNQALQVGQEQGYLAAIQQLSDEATKESCEVVTLTLWEEQVNMINVNCLDLSQNTSWSDTQVVVPNE